MITPQGKQGEVEVSVKVAGYNQNVLVAAQIKDAVSIFLFLSMFSRFFLASFCLLLVICFLSLWLSFLSNSDSFFLSFFLSFKVSYFVLDTQTWKISKQGKVHYPLFSKLGCWKNRKERSCFLKQLFTNLDDHCTCDINLYRDFLAQTINVLKKRLLH